jgi:hypothetical protein
MINTAPKPNEAASSANRSVNRKGGAAARRAPAEPPAEPEGKSPAASPPSPPRRLSEEIAGLIAAFGQEPKRLRDVLSVLRGRAYLILLLLLALPFCTPIPLPGFSAPFGVVIALIGFRLALNQKPWLPKKFLDLSLPPAFFARLLRGARRLIVWLEALMRPRWSWLLEIRILRHGFGAIILICGLLLLLPLPIPFSNGLPAMTIVLLAGARIERDGCCLAAGLAVFALTLGFYGALAWGGAEGMSALTHWVSRVAHGL